MASVLDRHVPGHWIHVQGHAHERDHACVDACMPKALRSCNRSCNQKSDLDARHILLILDTAIRKGLYPAVHVLGLRLIPGGGKKSRKSSTLAMARPCKYDHSHGVWMGHTPSVHGGVRVQQPLCRKGVYFPPPTHRTKLQSSSHSLETARSNNNSGKGGKVMHSLLQLFRPPLPFAASICSTPVP